MSFLNRMGLGFLDPTNELDKFANAIKDGDVSEIVERVSGLFESVEDRLDAIAELFESETAGSKEALGKTQREVQRKLRQRGPAGATQRQGRHRRQREGAGQAADG